MLASCARVPPERCRSAAGRRVTLDRMSPPEAVLLEGGERLTSSALSSLGWYRLHDKRVCGKPVWRHAVHSDRWLAFDGEAWLCQTTDCLGQARGMLQLPDPKCASPDQSLMPWKSPREFSSTGWTVQVSSHGQGRVRLGLEQRAG